MQAWLWQIHFHQVTHDTTMFHLLGFNSYLLSRLHKQTSGLTYCVLLFQVGSWHPTCACATQMSLLEPSHHLQPPLAVLDLAWWVIMGPPCSAINLKCSPCLLYASNLGAWQHCRELQNAEGADVICICLCHVNWAQ